MELPRSDKEAYAFNQKAMNHIEHCKECSSLFYAAIEKALVHIGVNRN